MSQVSSVRPQQVTALSAAQRMLRQGARGLDVAKLQVLLKRAGLNPGPVDGIFGPRTNAAVRQYQASRGLVVDGIVGPKTWGALNRNAPAVGGGRPVDGYEPGGTRVTGYVNGRPSSFNVSSIGNGKVLRSDAAGAYNRMVQAARAAGVNLYAVSGFRTMEQQRALYAAYLNGTGNLAARPGYSNHQGGISVDIGNVGGYGTRAYNWLRNNAGRFGFVNDVRGEYWHWTYKR